MHAWIGTYIYHLTPLQIALDIVCLLFLSFFHRFSATVNNRRRLRIVHKVHILQIHVYPTGAYQFLFKHKFTMLNNGIYLRFWNIKSITICKTCVNNASYFDYCLMKIRTYTTQIQATKKAFHLPLKISSVEYWSMRKIFVQNKLKPKRRLDGLNEYVFRMLYIPISNN